MIWQYLLPVFTLLGGLLLGIGVMHLRAVRRRRKKVVVKTPKRNRRAEVIDAAYAEIDKSEEQPNGLVFGFPPPPRMPELPREEPKMNRTGKIEVEGHPCIFLNGVLPPNFRPGECQGLCWNPDPGQRGRICFWTAPSATNCSWFRPKVLPTKVKLKKIG